MLLAATMVNTSVWRTNSRSIKPANSGSSSAKASHPLWANRALGLLAPIFVVFIVIFPLFVL